MVWTRHTVISRRINSQHISNYRQRIEFVNGYIDSVLVFTQRSAATTSTGLMLMVLICVKVLVVLFSVTVLIGTGNSNKHVQASWPLAVVHWPIIVPKVMLPGLKHLHFLFFVAEFNPGAKCYIYNNSVTTWCCFSDCQNGLNSSTKHCILWINQKKA